MKLPTRDEALQQLNDFGLEIKHLETDTSSMRRVRFNGKNKRNQYGFYRAHSILGTNLVAGVYGTWWPIKQVHKFVGENENERLTAQQKFKIEKAFEQSKKQVDSFEPDLKIWDDAEECDTHPYLDEKKVKSYGLRKAGDELLLPQFNRLGELVGLQRIFPDGTKKMVYGSKTKGAFHEIAGSDVVAICEGYSTGATIHEATGWTTVICFNASNMLNVAGHYKTRRMIVCADNDKDTKIKHGHNAGVEYGMKVAEKYFAKCITPIFEGDENKDFNDLGIEETKRQLSDKEPLSFIEQVMKLGCIADQERFIIDRKSLLASYPKEEFSFLKNRLKGLDITKSFMDDVIKGVLSEAEILEMEEAEEQLKTVRYDGNSYFRIDDKKFYATSSQEISLLLNLATKKDEAKKHKLLNKIHRDQMVGSISAVPMPFGESYIEEFLGAEGIRFIKKHVSIQENIESRLAELENVKVDEGFIEYIKSSYPEVIAIMEASLARKFCQNKKAFVYLNCPTNYGKNFFFEIDSLGRTFTHTYEPDEFRGNSPEDFLKPLYFFIDEAEKFPSHYKINEPEYKRLYGGLTKVKIGMRILACANKMEDIERGVDPQLMQRIIVIKPNYRKFTHKGIERNLSQRMWEKYILNRLSNRLNEWSVDGNFDTACEQHFEEFIKRYDNMDKFRSLEDILIENLSQLFDFMIDSIDEQRIDEFKTGKGFDFKNHLIWVDDSEYLITSPSRFMKELFMYFDETRYPAFRKQFHSVEDLAELPFFDGKSRKIRGKLSKGLFVKRDFSGYLAESYQKTVTLDGL